MQNQSGAKSSRSPSSETAEPQIEGPADERSAGLSGTGFSGAGSLRFALVGPGRVGATLGRWLIQSGARLERLSGSRADSPRLQGLVEVAREAGGEAIWQPLTELGTGNLDLLLITVSDPALEQVVDTLSRRPQARVAMHVAGQFDAEILAPLRSAGCRIGSMHPLKAFVDPVLSDREARSQAESPSGVWFGIDGDLEARQLARGLAAEWGALSTVVTGDRRAVYHLAATLAAGGVATLLSVVEELLEVAELPSDLLEAYMALTRGALAAIDTAIPGKEMSVASKITGPAARGDLATLQRQKEVLETLAPRLLPLVEGLQNETLRRCGWAPLQGSGGKSEG